MDNLTHGAQPLLTHPHLHSTEPAFVAPCQGVSSDFLPTATLTHKPFKLTCVFCPADIACSKHYVELLLRWQGAASQTLLLARIDTFPQELLRF